MNETWLNRKAWRDNRIRSSARGGAVGIGFFALFWNAIAFPAVVLGWDEIMQKYDSEPAILIIFIFPVVGIILIAAAANLIRKLIYFGSTPLTLDPFPGSIGGQVAGTINTNILYNHEHAFEVILSCCYSYISGSGKNRSRKERVIWQSEGYCKNEQLIAQNARGTRLKFCFDVPAGLRESEASRSSAYYYWKLSIRAKLDGPDFNRDYDIPVYATACRASANFENSLENATSRKSAELGIESIAKIESISGGIELYFSAFRRPSLGIFMVIFGSIFCGAGIGAGYLGAPILFPIIFSGLGGLTAVSGLHYLLKSLRVRVSSNKISSLRYVLGLRVRSSTINIDELSSIEIKKSGTSQSGSNTTVHYSLIALTHEGRKLPLGDRLIKRAEAELLKDTYLSYLGPRHS